MGSLLHGNTNLSIYACGRWIEPSDKPKDTAAHDGEIAPFYDNHNSNYHNNHNHQDIVVPVVKVVVSLGSVGWTGTQDKRGKLVVLPLKYPLQDSFFKCLSFDAPLQCALSQCASLFQIASSVSHLRRLPHDYSACS